MGRTAQNKKMSVPVIQLKGKFRELIDKTLQDKAFRESLESNPQRVLASIGIDVTDPTTVSYLKRNLSATDESLLRDGQKKKVVASVVSGAGIVVAASTPAFPKGDGTAVRDEEEK